MMDFPILRMKVWVWDKSKIILHIYFYTCIKTFEGSKTEIRHATYYSHFYNYRKEAIQSFL